MIYIDSECPYQIDVVKVEILKYPPTSNRLGKTRGPNDIKTIITVKTDIVKVPMLLMSDIHSHTNAVINDLEQRIDLSKYIILTLGDMAGELIYGSDGDPTLFYQRLNKNSELYICQGNHDLPPPNINDLTQLINKNGLKCFISDGENIITTANGTIGGVHGTISNKEHPYKKTENHYMALLENILKCKKPDILMTHDTPEIPIISNEFGKIKPTIGKKEIFDCVSKYKPKIHVYGHCHHPFAFMYVNNVLFINADSRIILLEPFSSK